jgi:hypothetical protein
MRLTKFNTSGGLEMGRIKFVVKEEWDKTLFYLATLSLVFLVGCAVRIIAG